ncbi:PREDICTED: trans-1,2-dihydrobenzene-1,2-diol dehydrogenase-like, partial [Dipodomys ordii]|uniref:Trans-1,2-dihydrobenzene-1,2-diol dehydrogenase n=1 Tax=Dipodomys ordii TaxID=10020 RepID=A0A1S3GW96_DIPOR
PHSRASPLTCLPPICLLHLPELLSLTLFSLQVVAVAARDLSRAKEFARKHDIPKAYGSYAELAKDPNVEVVYVGTQHPQHKDTVLLCLAAGKAVLCEKPMGVTAAEVREMVAEARSRGLFLMEVRLESPGCLMPSTTLLAITKDYCH